MGKVNGLSLPVFLSVMVMVSLALPVAAWGESPNKDRAQGGTPVREKPSAGNAGAMAFSGPQPIEAGETLDLEKAVDIALKLNPAIQAATGTARANESLIGQAKSSYYPQGSLSVAQQQYSITNHNIATTGQTGRFALSGLTTAASISQDIWDFGKTADNVRVQKYNFSSSEEDLQDVRESVVLQVKQAYYGLLGARRNLNVAGMVVDQFEQHLRQAIAFHTAGIKPRFDVTQAQVNLSNAKLNLIVARNAADVALANLNNVMGVPRAPAYNVAESLAFSKYEITFPEALARAYKNRPDLKSLLLREGSARESINLVKTGYYPTLSGAASYGYTGDRLPLDSYWTAGVTLSFPFFSGFQTKYQLIQARENLNVARANEQALQQGIYLEVQTGYLNLKAAQDRVQTAQLTVQQARENLDVATGMYKYGVGSPLDVTDALTTFSGAETSYTAALYDYKTAQASLEKAMGLYSYGGAGR